jgi:hypothetical protein
MKSFTKRLLCLTAVYVITLAWPGLPAPAQEGKKSTANQYVNTAGTTTVGTTKCFCCACCTCQKKPGDVTNGNPSKIDIHVECACCGGKTPGPSPIVPPTIGMPGVVVLFATLLELPRCWPAKGKEKPEPSDECKECHSDLQECRTVVERLRETEALLQAELTVVRGARDLATNGEAALKNELIQLRKDLAGSQFEERKLTGLLRTSEIEIVKRAGEVRDARTIISQKEEKIDELTKNLGEITNVRDSAVASLKSQQERIQYESVILGWGRVAVAIIGFIFFLALTFVAARLCIGLMHQDKEAGFLETSWAGFGGGLSCWKVSRLGVAAIFLLVSLGILATFTDKIVQSHTSPRPDGSLKATSKGAVTERRDDSEIKFKVVRGTE